MCPRTKISEKQERRFVEPSNGNLGSSIRLYRLGDHESFKF